jgi:hypothetical protein
MVLIYMCVCVCVRIYIKNQKKKGTTSRMARGHGNKAADWHLVPGIGAGGMRLSSQALQDDAYCLQDLMSLLWFLGDLHHGKHPMIHEGVASLYH